MRLSVSASSLIPLVFLSALSGCANLAPDYARPALPVPSTLDGRVAGSKALVQPEWQTLVTDPRLRSVVELALANNRDLRVATLSIEKARAKYRVADAARFPAVVGTSSAATNSANDTITRKYSAGLGVSQYELDFFNRLNNLSDSAMQGYLSTESAQRTVRASLIAEVVNGWLSLATDERLLSLSRETWESRKESLELTRQQLSLGGASELTLAQASASAEAARGDVAGYTNQVTLDSNALNLLCGTSVPKELLPTHGDQGDVGVMTLVDVPDGLPSEVLLQRPDIVSAEHALRAAYADVGAARAAFFPSITLTATGGVASSALGELFAAGGGVWSLVPALTLPIFNAGKLEANLKTSEAEQAIQVATYEKTVLTAFKEVADALSVRATLSERLAARQGEVEAYATSFRLSTERYHAGADSYLAVLDSQRSLYAAQKSLISLQLVDQSNRIALFKVLGGR